MLASVLKSEMDARPPNTAAKRPGRETFRREGRKALAGVSKVN